MNTTTHYGLCQWDADDRILRTDFNADNAKIDEALAAFPYVRLMSITTSSAAIQVNMDVSSIDFTQYQKIDLFFHSTASCPPMSLFLNGVSSQEYLRVGASASSTATTDELTSYLMSWDSADGVPQAVHLELKVPGVGCAILCQHSGASVNGQLAYHVSNNDLAASTTITWDKLKILNFLSYYGETAIPAGTEISLYGVKR